MSGEKEIDIKVKKRTIWGWTKFLLEKGFFLFGIYAAIFLVVIGVDYPIYQANELRYDHFAESHSSELREIAIDIGRGCRSDAYCWAESFYYNLSGIEYVYTGKNDRLYDPLFTYETMTGDCKQGTILFVALMKSVGFDAETKCAAHHCVALIPNYDHNEEQPGYMLVDMVNHVKERHDDNESIYERIEELME